MYVTDRFSRLRWTLLATCFTIAGLGAGLIERAAAQELRMADLGTCPLESGEVLESA